MEKCAVCGYTHTSRKETLTNTNNNLGNYEDKELNSLNKPFIELKVGTSFCNYDEKVMETATFNSQGMYDKEAILLMCPICGTVKVSGVTIDKCKEGNTNNTSNNSSKLKVFICAYKSTILKVYANFESDAKSKAYDKLKSKGILVDYSKIACEELCKLKEVN